MDTSDHAADTAVQGFIDKVRLRQPRRPEPKQVISVRLRVEAIERIDALAEVHGITKSAFIETAIEEALDTFDPPTELG